MMKTLPMNTTTAAARWLRAVPPEDAGELLAAVERAAHRLPETTANVKPMGGGLWQLRCHQYRVLFGLRDGTPVVVSGCLKTSGPAQQRAVAHAVHELDHERQRT